MKGTISLVDDSGAVFLSMRFDPPVFGLRSVLKRGSYWAGLRRRSLGAFF